MGFARPCLSVRKDRGIVAGKAAFDKLLHTMPVHLFLQLRATQQSTSVLPLWSDAAKWDCCQQSSLKHGAAHYACTPAPTVMDE